MWCRVLTPFRSDTVPHQPNTLLHAQADVPAMARACYWFAMQLNFGGQVARPDGISELYVFRILGVLKAGFFTSG